MEGRLKYKVQQFKDALLNFEESLSINLDEYPTIVIDTLKSGRIQKFEFCTELLWKTLKVYLWEINGIDSKSPKMVIKDYYKLGLLSTPEYEQVMEIINDRNKLSHIYGKEQFEEIYQRVIKVLPLFFKVRDVLEAL
ncbi:MAG: nucleotidyltransferase [SAR324 cluster bacterium]|uniref:Nucleotidyltransferase n=1 Tax=SAR324 cluster bacterium TaxID=2024889 RepID=A0A2A4T7Y1_9DELT|nr:MAG: nucleotidyltransferase [SAR324 cluster bacterium]